MALTRAYILIETNVGQGPKVVTTLQGLPEVKSADRVSGIYDIITVIEVDDLQAVGSFVTQRVHTISGVRRSITCLALG